VRVFIFLTACRGSSEEGKDKGLSFIRWCIKNSHHGVLSSFRSHHHQAGVLQCHQCGVFGLSANVEAVEDLRRELEGGLRLAPASLKPDGESRVEHFSIELTCSGQPFERDRPFQEFSITVAYDAHSAILLFRWLWAYFAWLTELAEINFRFFRFFRFFRDS